MDKLKDKLKEQAAIGKRIKQVRKDTGLNQKAFAREIGICNTYLSFIERGLKGPKFEVFYNLASRFDISLDYLFFGAEPMKLSKRINPGRDERTQVDEILTPRDIVWYMNHSTLFRDTMMSYAAKFCLDNEEIIKKNVDNTRKRQGDGGKEDNENEK